MSLVPAKSARIILLAILVSGMFSIASAQQTSRRPVGVRFAEPDAPATGTNTTITGSQKPTLGTLDQTIKKPFEFFKSEEALGSGMLPPPPRRAPTPAASKQAKELLDRRKNWVFSTPEEIYGVQTPEEMLDLPEYTPDGELKAPKTTFERYLERMEKTRTDSGTNQAAADRVPAWMKPEKSEKTSANDSRTASGTPSPSGSLFGVPTTEVKPPAGSLDFSSTSGSSSVSERLNDFFSASTTERLPTRDTARDARLLEFKQLLESRTPLVSGWNGAVTPPRVPAAPASPYPVSPYSRDSYSPQPAARPAPLPAYTPSAAPPSYSPPVYTAPPATPTRSLAPTPAFELPKRKF